MSDGKPASERLEKIEREVDVVKNDIDWIKRFQWWQLGLLVPQAVATVALASKLLGGPGPAEAANAVIRLFA